MRGRILIPVTTLAAIGAALAVTPGTFAQRDIGLLDPQQAEAQLERAKQAATDAEERATRLASEAEAAIRAADRSAKQAAAIAAQIQKIEANIATAQAEYSLAQASRLELSNRLAERRQPLVGLTAALQTMAQRPLALSALQPGSLRETVYVRAVLDSAVPAVRERTLALRGELDRGRQLESDARDAIAALSDGERDLRDQRAALQRVEA